MTRSRKIIATCALTVGVLGGMAGPALAATAPPPPPDHHADFMPPPPENHPDFGPTENHPD